MDNLRSIGGWRNPRLLTGLLCIMSLLVLPSGHDFADAQPDLTRQEDFDRLKEINASGPTLQFGPVEGFTTTYHSAPEVLVLPIETEIEFRILFSAFSPEASFDWQIEWQGVSVAEPNDRAASFNAHTLGTFAVGATLTYEDVDTKRTYLLETEVHVVQLEPEALEFNFIVEPRSRIDQDELETNGDWIDAFYSKSFAEPVWEEETLIVAVPYSLRMRAVVEDADPVLNEALTALIERRVDGRAWGLNEITYSGWTPRRVPFSVGPVEHAKAFMLQSYRVEMESDFPIGSIPENIPLRYEAHTVPEGYEEYVQWLAATELGSAEPQTGQGRFFVTTFRNTTGPRPSLNGQHGQWIGVRGGGFRQEQDDKTTGATPVVHSINPKQSAPGDIVTILGSDFDTTLSGNFVRFGGNSATKLAGTESSLTVIVPSGEGEVEVTVQSNGNFSEPYQGFEINPALDPLPITEIDLAAGAILGAELELPFGFVIREVLIFFAPDVSTAEKQQFVQSINYSEIVAMQDFPSLGFSRAITNITDPQDTLDLIERLNNDARVDVAFLNTILTTSQSEDPFELEAMWSENIGLGNLPLYFNTRGEGIKMAVIDSGVNLSSGEFAFQPEAPEGFNMADDRTPSNGQDAILNGQDYVGHGTRVASLASARDNNFNGTGLAADAQVLPIRATYQLSRNFSRLWVATGLLRAFEYGAHVINMSLQESPTNPLNNEDAADFYARVLQNLRTSFANVDPIIVASSGNRVFSGASEARVYCPACSSEVIAVGSAQIDSDASVNLVSTGFQGGDWMRAANSRYGVGLDFLAQGPGLAGTNLDDEFVELENNFTTSFAAPQVTGLAALILSERPGLSQLEVETLIKRCFVDDIEAQGWDEETGWGRIAFSETSDVPGACVLKSPSASIFRVNTGSLQITLSWNSAADLDLGVIEPAGSILSVDQRSSNSGGLFENDINCNSAIRGGPENIYWPTSRTPLLGEYQIQIQYFGSCGSTRETHWELRIATEGTLKVFKGTFESDGTFIAPDGEPIAPRTSIPIVDCELELRDAFTELNGGEQSVRKLYANCESQID